MLKTATPTIVPTARILKKLNSGCKTEPLLPGLALLIVVITGITKPIPKASTAVPKMPKSITNGTLRLDCFGYTAHALRIVSKSRGGLIIWLQNYRKPHK